MTNQNNEQEVLELAKKCGFTTNRLGEIFPAGDDYGDPITTELELFATALRENDAKLIAMLERARAEEREACAKVCDYYSDGSSPRDISGMASLCAAAIRARKP